MLDFGALPPEVNSVRMYSGPGSTPLMAAASAWNALAAELNSAAIGYDGVTTQLTDEEWLGPASASMAEAVSPYVAWMNTTAAQAEQAATHARAAAAAYETALAATVPPPQIATNRAQLAQLVSTNVMGQNTGQIAALESEYGQMWAQDAAAMYGYAGSSATAAKVTPFTAAPQIANPAASGTQAAAVTQAAGSSAGTTQSTLSHVVNRVPNTLQSLATPAASSSASSTTSSEPLSWLWRILFGTSVFPSSIEGFLTDYTPYAQSLYYTVGVPYFSIGMVTYLLQSGNILNSMGAAAKPAAAAAGAAAGAAGHGLAGLGGLLGSGGAVSAGLGNAASVGPLSVPSSWVPAAPGLSGGAAPPPINGSVNFAPDNAGAGNLLGGMPLTGPGAGSVAGSGPRYGFRPTVMARPPFAG